MSQDKVSYTKCDADKMSQDKVSYTKCHADKMSQDKMSYIYIYLCTGLCANSSMSVRVNVNVKLTRLGFEPMFPVLK